MKRAFAFMFLALALSTTVASSASAGEVSIVFVRFHEGTIADPGPGSMDTVWLPEDFDQQYQQLLGRVEAAGVTGLRPVGIAWRHLDERRSKGHAVPADLVDFSTVYAAQLGVMADPEQVAATLSAFEEVEYAEVPGSGEFFDRYTSDQWWMENTGQTTVNCYGSVLYCTEDIDANVPEGWAYADSSDALVGILDSGVYTNGDGIPDNSDLAGVYNSDLSRDFTGSGMDDASPYHGTKVAGIVAGSGENLTDYEGVVGFTSPSGWDPLVVYRTGVSAPADPYVLDALDFICNPDSAAYGKVRVINCSWGAEDPGATLSDAFSNAYDEDIAILAAAGNSPGLANWPYPAAYIDFTEAVAHILCDSTRLNYYQGNFVDVTAPGGSHIQTTDYNSGTFDCFGGTSSSAPIAAGVASLLLGYCPDLTNNDVYALLECTAEDIGASGYDNHYGNGLIRADAALEALEAAGCGVNVESVASSSVTYVNSLTMAMTNLPNRTGRTSWAKVYRVSGTISLVPGEDRVITCVWARGRDCHTVRGPEDLYYLGSSEWPTILPYFDGKRLDTWASVEHSSGTNYAVHGYAYHLYDDSSEQVDRGWYPFNPYLSPPNPMFAVAYLEADEAKRIVKAAGTSASVQSGPMMQLSGTEVSLYLASPTVVEIEVYDVSGRAVLGLGQQVVPAGDNAWDLRSLLCEQKASSGLYFVRVTVDGRRLSGKVVFVR